MRRKLVKQGQGALVITVPKKWIDKRRLKAGDEIDIEEFQKGLLLIPGEKKKRQKEITLELSKKSKEEVRHTIMNAYSVGFDSIKINYDNEKWLRKITKDYLEGFEITKIKNHKFLIEEITQASSKDMLYFVTKIFWILKELINQLEENTEEQFENSIKYYFFIRRYLITIPISERSKVFLWEFLSDLGNIITTIHHMNINIKKKKIILKKEDREVINKIKEWIFIMYESYEKKDINKLPKINEELKQFLYDKWMKRLEKEPVKYHHFLSITRNIYKSNLTLIGLTQTNEFEEFKD